MGLPHPRRNDADHARDQGVGAARALAHYSSAPWIWRASFWLSIGMRV